MDNALPESFKVNRHVGTRLLLASRRGFVRRDTPPFSGLGDYFGDVSGS